MKTTDHRSNEKMSESSTRAVARIIGHGLWSLSALCLLCGCQLNLPNTTYPPQRPCDESVEDCLEAELECDEEALNACGECGPTPHETCNGVDDDCDGLVDENLERACGADTGTCRRGAQICDDGHWAECVGGRPAEHESCDGLDNDCDALVDESCADDGPKTLNDCNEEGSLPEEVCNGMDDDCDGDTDEGVLRDPRRGRPRRQARRVQ